MLTGEKKKKKAIGNKNKIKTGNPPQHLKINPKVYPGFARGDESFWFCNKYTLQDLFQD